MSFTEARKIKDYKIVVASELGLLYKFIQEHIKDGYIPHSGFFVIKYDTSQANEYYQPMVKYWND